MFRNKLFISFLFLFSVFISFTKASTVNDPDRVCGKWMSAEKNLMVQVYKEDGAFRAKIIWFKNEDNSKPMEEWRDKHNPDETLRNRRLIGMSILQGLDYIPKSNSWENGKIYDPKHGREWDASAYINKEGQLKVTGYWHFKFIGRTMTFVRV
ncbi:MAG TPA: DUF2147 domain-containing protein [Mucilaginibacter sp.]|jgi:uncharacterized protein (DUF2147 family)|nr:DUF2147 domain-containing protein [Mucilaginibacter sp.]